MKAIISDVRQELEDLAAWRSGLSDAVDTILGISSPRLSTDGRGSGTGMALPFHLDQAVDEPDRGGAGVRTEAGLLDLLGSWARSIAHDRGETVKGSPLTYLHTTLAWAQQHADWDGLSSDIHDAWVAVGRIVGHAPVPLAQCPRCGGKVTTDPTEYGIPQWGACEDCQTWYASLEDVARTRADERRSVAVKDTIYVTTPAALRLWPELDRGTIRDWKDAGKLPSDAGKLHLRTLNQLANVLIEKRGRPGWGHASRENVAHKASA